MDAAENIEGETHLQNADKYQETSLFKQLEKNVKDDDIEKYIEKFKLDSEEELLLRVHKLNEQVHDEFKIPSKPPIKKISLKMKMLKKLHDHHMNFQLKNLHEVVKQLKKLHSNKTMYLQKDTKEAYVRKKRLGIELEKIDIEELEAILWMINHFKIKTDFRFNKDLILNLVKVKKLWI